MKLKDAMKTAKATRKPVKVNERTPVTEIKINTSIRLDLDVLNWCKSEADRQGIPYTTLINSILKKASTVGTLEDRVEALEKALKRGRTA